MLYTFLIRTKLVKDTLNNFMIFLGLELIFFLIIVGKTIAAPTPAQQIHRETLVRTCISDIQGFSNDTVKVYNFCDSLAKQFDKETKNETLGETDTVIDSSNDGSTL